MGLDHSGGKAESGRALKYRLMSGMGKARRSGGMLIQGLAKAYELALRREDILAGRPPRAYEIGVRLADKFLADEEGTAVEIQTLRSANVLSVERAVEMTGLAGQAAAEEVARITAEITPRT